MPITSEDVDGRNKSDPRVELLSMCALQVSHAEVRPSWQRDSMPERAKREQMRLACNPWSDRFELGEFDSLPFWYT